MDALSSSHAGSQLKLIPRIVTLFWLKCVGSTLAISAFFVAYFLVLNHPFSEAFLVPRLAPDDWTPVLPWSTWIYFSLWVYICMPSSLMVRVNELGYYLMGATFLSLFGIAIFYFLPTQVPPWGIDWSRYPTLLFLKEADTSGNSCPSLHVAFALYAGLWLSRMLTLLQVAKCWHFANAFWCLLIILSTMTTKQHVFIDLLCGVLLGFFVFWVNGRIARRLKLAAFASNARG